MLSFSLVFIILYFHDHETIPKQAKQLSEDLWQVVITTQAKDPYIKIVAILNRRMASIRVVSVVVVSRQAISTIVRRRLYMNGIYTRVPQFCIPLSVQSR